MSIETGGHLLNSDSGIPDGAISVKFGYFQPKKVEIGREYWCQDREVRNRRLILYTLSDKYPIRWSRGSTHETCLDTKAGNSTKL
jgi:hypothetical protein